MAKRECKPIELPFSILVDDRERISGGQWTFDGLLGDSSEGYRPIKVRLVERRLETGDYSILGMEHLVAVERKAVSDIFSTIGQGRERFEDEHRRMMGMQRAMRGESGGEIQQSCWVVVEGTWPMIARKEGIISRLHPMAVFGVCQHWTTRYGVAWETLPGRRAAEVWTFRRLRAVWEQWEKVKQVEVDSI